MKSREELISVFNETLDDIKEGNYVNPVGDIVDFPKMSKLKKGTKMYESIGPVSSHNVFTSPKIYAQNIDTFQKARDLGENCAVLNMASHRTPGGGVTKGSRAQEEELCRRSNLIYSLYSFISTGKTLFGFSNIGKEQSYPIPVYGGIYSPCVSVYKTSVTYTSLDVPYLCNVISVAGVVHPQIDPSTGLIMKKYVHIVKGKIRTILRIAMINGHTKLVLGALGCGAFKNPPKHISLLFKEVLEESEFKNSFEEICFAILEDHNSNKEHNPEGNLKPFAEIFGLENN